jgi:uncharacterized membrane protein YccF (DUF307 family)
MAVAWLVAAVLMAITLVGLPWARAAFTIARYTFLPFGRVALPRDEVEGQEDLRTGPLGTIGNVLWLVLAGWWLALGHVITAIGLAITIIGIPFAWAHLKLAALLFPGRPIDDRPVLAGIGRPPVNSIAEVEPVIQDLVDRPLVDRLGTCRPA